MNRSAASGVELHRLDGGVLSLGCQICHLLQFCGGQTRIGGGWSCATRCAGCDRERCDLVCFGKPSVYCEAVEEVNGFDAGDIGPIFQQLAIPLPKYIPVLQHHYSRVESLKVPWVAIPLSAILKASEDALAPIATTPEMLREVFHLSSETRTLLLGTGEDEPIERYWEARRVRDLPEALAGLEWSMAIAPNYSLFLDDPRPQHFHNRKRSLICAAEWSTHRIPTAPYLHAVCRRDYDYWLDFLRDHPEIRLVAKEFQTGASRWERGMWAIEQLAWLQDALKRDLHPVAIGAAQYRRELARRFRDWTIIDSMPFMRAMHRKKAHRGDRRVHWISQVGVSPDALLACNAKIWGRWIEDLIETEPRRRDNSPPRLQQDARQLTLPLKVTMSGPH